MKAHQKAGWLLAVSLAAAVLAAGAAAAEPPSCATSPALSALGTALDHSAARLARKRALQVVALGSSSTAGFGASAAEMNYPSRLEEELRDRFPGSAIEVVNRGVGGQDIGEEFARLGRDVIALRPDLMIWQVGTNAVLRRDNFATDRRTLRRGVATLKESGIEVVLMDLQYAPQILGRRSYRDMERLIADTAERMHVGLFRRFAIMARWAQRRQLAPAPMIASDGLHMTDASYGCLADALAEALAWNWWFQAAPALASAPGAVARVGAREHRSVSVRSTQTH
jgi:acyl-CoA thioesterase I